jgi:hypothetical protein
LTQDALRRRRASGRTNTAMGFPCRVIVISSPTSTRGQQVRQGRGPGVGLPETRSRQVGRSPLAGLHWLAPTESRRGPRPCPARPHALGSRPSMPLADRMLMYRLSLATRSTRSPSRLICCDAPGPFRARLRRRSPGLGRLGD